MMKLGNKDFDHSTGGKRLYYTSIFGAIWFMCSFIVRSISSEGVVFNGLIGFICMLVIFFEERKKLKTIQGFKDTSDVKAEQLTYTLSEKDDEGKRVLYFQNNSSYPVVDFCVEGISQSLKKTVGYRINSIVLPNKTVQNRVDNSPDDIEIYKIKFTYLAENNSNVNVEYDLNLDSYKIDSEQQLEKPSKIRKWYNRLVLTWFAFSLLFAFASAVTWANKGNENTILDPAVTNSADVDSSDDGLINTDPDVTIDQIEFDIEGYTYNYYVDSINNCWGEFRYVNNSQYPISNLLVTIMETNTGEKSYLNFYDTNIPGETSPIDKTILAHSVDNSMEPDIEFLEFKYTYQNDVGDYVHVIYDPKLDKYQYRRW